MRCLPKLQTQGGNSYKGERYIFAMNTRGTILAHPMISEWTGKTLLEMTDSEGKAFIRKITNTGRNRGYGFIEYKWPHPETGIELRKTVFFEKVNGMIFCSGFYS